MLQKPLYKHVLYLDLLDILVIIAKLRASIIMEEPEGARYAPSTNYQGGKIP